MENYIVKYDAILHPTEAFFDYQKELLELYLEDYGEEHSQPIVNRMNDTVYIFDANPIDKMNFLKKHEHDIHDLSEQIKIEYEYYDYMREKKKIEKKYLPHYYEALASYHDFPIKRFYQELLDLDFESFSIENQALLKNDNIVSNVKEKILERQQKYLQMCKSFGATAVVDGFKVQHLLDMRKDMMWLMRSELIRKTKWGKKIQKKVYKEVGLKIDEKDLASLLYSKETASTSFFSNGNHSFVLCFFPIMKIDDICEIDVSFFHENRHVIESGKATCGIDAIYHSRYEMLNEVRTQKKAEQDAEKLKKIPLFSNQPISSDFFNAYAGLYPYSEEFINQYESLLDHIAIGDNIYLLEQLFGKDNLMEYSQYLTQLEEEYVLNQGELIEDTSVAKKYIYQLNQHYKSRQ